MGVQQFITQGGVVISKKSIKFSALVVQSIQKKNDVNNIL